VAGYALTFAALMLTGGKLADLLGRRRVFVAGLVVFTLASLACGLAGSAEVLIGARVVQGIGAAMMNPATLSIITATFPPRQRGTAIGIWAGVSALALAIGPLVGGLLSEHVDWSWIFFVNVPVGIVAIAAAYAFIDESRDTSRDQRPDVPGLVTSGVGLFALTYALIEANSHGWGSTRILGAFALAAVSLAAFVLLELRQRRPMLDLTLFRNATFSGANVAMLLVALAMFGVFFYVSLYVQQILGYSPVEAGASFLPATILIAVLAPFVGRVVDRVGSRWLTSSGMVLLALSLVLFARLGTGSSYWEILPGLVVMGVGMALTMTPTTAAAMGSVPRDQAGVGSAVLNSMRQVGGSLGIAITGAIVAHVTSTSLAAGDTQPVAFVHGFQRGLEVAAAIALAGAVVAVVSMRGHREQLRAPSDEPAFQEAA
jgi:EmrB/QacA subfamily drug resistance transporter